MANKTKILNQVQKYITKGQWEKAIKELQKLIAEDPSDVRTLLKLGDVYSKQGDRESATRVYRQVAESYSEQGFFLKAVAVYKQILKHDPNHLEVTLRLAELYEQLNLASEALSQYQHASRIHEEAGDAKRSLEVLRRMVDLDPHNVASRIKLAEGFSREQMISDAAMEFERAAALLKDQNRVEDYIKVAERLVYHDPGRLDVVKEVARLLLSQGETKRGLAKLQVLYKENTKDVETLQLLARAFSDLGQTQKTLFVYRELARLHQEQGRTADASAVYRQVLEIEPTDPEAAEALAESGPSRPVVPQSHPAPIFGPLSSGGTPVPTAPPTSGPPVVAPSLAPRPRPMDPPPPGPMAPSLAPRPAPPPPRSAPGFASADMLPDEDLGIALGSMDLIPQPTVPSQDPSSQIKSQIQKILTETDVFVRYGLREKALQHVEKVFDLDPDHVGAHEKIRDIHLSGGDDANAAEAVAKLVQIFTRRGTREMVDRHRAELARLAPNHPIAGGAEPAPEPSTPVPPAGPESISIDIGEGQDAFEFLDSGELSSVEVSTTGLIGLEDEPDPDPFAGAVAAEDEGPDPFAGALVEPREPITDGMGLAAPAQPSLPPDLDPPPDLDLPSGSGDLAAAAGLLDLTEGETSAQNTQVVMLEELEEGEGTWDGAFPSSDFFPTGGASAGPSTDAENTPLTDDEPQTQVHQLELDSEDLVEEEPDPRTAGVAPPGSVPENWPPPEESPFVNEVAFDEVDPFSTGGWSAPSVPAKPSNGPAESPHASSTNGVHRGFDFPESFDESATDTFLVSEDGIRNSALEPPPPIFEEPEPSAPSIPPVDPSLDDELEEAEFMLQAGLLSDALEILESIHTRAPDHPRIDELMHRVRAEMDGAEAESSVRLEAAPESTQRVDVPNESMGLHTADLAERVEAMVGEEMGGEIVEDGFDRGLMYRDLGRYEDAIAAFKEGLRDPERSLASLEMIGHCLRDRGEIKAGIECFKLALKKGAEGPAATNLKYEIAAAYELVEEFGRAVQWYISCSDDDPSHRDVEGRLRVLSKHATPRSGPRSSRNKISFL